MKQIDFAKVLLFFLGIFFPLSGTNSLCEFQADSIGSEGKTITLTGNVSILHRLGKITCDSAIVERKEEGKEKLPASICLKDNIELFLKPDSTVSCARGMIDFVQNKIFLYSEEEHPVRYSGSIDDSEITAEKFMILGGLVTFSLDSKGEIELVEVSQGTFLEIDKEITVKGERAVYKPDDRLSIYPSEESFCVITGMHGIQARASLVEWNFPEKKMTFLSGSGSGSFTDTIQPEFRADKIVWDKGASVFTFSGYSRLEQKEKMIFFNDDHIDFFYDKEGLTSIKTAGKSRLLGNKKLQSDCFFITEGDICVDHRLGCVNIGSTRNQIVFKGNIGEVSGDYLSLYYSLGEAGFIPEKILIRDNVKFMGPDNAKQFALADLIEYSKITGEWKLQAKSNGKVLYYDKINNMQMSAPGVLYKKGTGLEKDIIQGSGNVRFRFMERELDLLKKRFNLSEERK